VRVHGHGLLFVEYSFNIDTFPIEMQWLAVIWNLIGGKIEATRTGKATENPGLNQGSARAIPNADRDPRKACQKGHGREADSRNVLDSGFTV
jgi:hypothetical protein